MLRHRFKIAARYFSSTERGWVSRDIEAAAALSSYRGAPGMHWLNAESVFYSRAGATQALDTFARTVRWMDAGLRPSRAWRVLFGSDAGGMRCGVHPSGFDHTNVWRYKGGYVVTTEPYGVGVPAALDWCKEQGWTARKLPEWGMWYPPCTTLIVCSPPRRGADLDDVLAALAKLTPVPMDDRQRGIEP